jgi:glycosyltransferase involved in cell wall biosynthesis
LEFYLRSHYPESHIRQIYNSIPINNIHVDRDIVRQKFNVKPKSLWIASVARLEKPKNLDLLIDAGKRLFEQGIDIRVSIFGIGPLKKYLENKIDQNGLNSCIKLEGFVEDIFPVLKSIDIFTLTSFHEGLPMSLLEALSVETAVVCTSVGGMKEIITNGYSGILVKSNNAAELSDAFLNLNTDTVKREKIGQNGRQEIIKKFAIEITNQKLIRFYNDLLLDN